MLLPQEALTGQAQMQDTFKPEDLPDARLYRRLKITGEGLLRAILQEGDERPQEVKRAERRGASRLYANPRVDADRLSQRAQERCIQSLQALPRILVAHDTVEFDLHGRYEPRDAGPLRSSDARGYLARNRSRGPS